MQVTSAANAYSIQAYARHGGAETNTGDQQRKPFTVVEGGRSASSPDAQPAPSTISPTTNVVFTPELITFTAATAQAAANDALTQQAGAAAYRAVGQRGGSDVAGQRLAVSF